MKVAQRRQGEINAPQSGVVLIPEQRIRIPIKVSVSE